MLKLAVLLLAGAIGFACSWDYLIWIPRSATADALYRFVVDGKAGYIDRQGKVVMEPRLEFDGNSGGEFHSGLLKDHSKKGQYLDRSGKVVEGENLGSESEFSEGLAVRRVGEKVGYVGRDGRFVIEPKFLHGTAFHEGRARILIEGNCMMSAENRCGGLTLIGERNGRDLPDCRFEYIDVTGTVMTNGQYQDGGEFSEGLAPVRVRDLWGFIDKNGLMVIEPQFFRAHSFSEGLARVWSEDFHGFIDKSGQRVLKPKATPMEDFHEGFAVVTLGEHRYRYIDKSGQYVLGGEYEAASPFFKGLAHVKKGKKFSYIDTSGKVVFQY